MPGRRRRVRPRIHGAGEGDLTALQQAAEAPGWLASTILGIVEGLTEFLPISSTGHLIVTNRLLGADDPTFEIAIQAGAITAIAVLYRERLFAAVRKLKTLRAEGRTNLLVLLVIAAMPASIVGLLFKDQITAVLFSVVTVATTLIAGGVLLLVLEAWLARRERAGRANARGVDDITATQALGIGVVQILALVPGTSRAGAVMAGGLLFGLKRTAAAEFSFLVGLPVLYGACFVELLDDWERVSGPLLGDFAIASAAAFVTAIAVVVPFVRFLENHTFKVFAWYRIAAGIVFFALIAAGVIRD